MCSIPQNRPLLKQISRVLKAAFSTQGRNFYGRGIACLGKKTIMNCNCKAALITGGAEGIGLAIAHQILAEKARNVALVGMDNCKGRDAVNLLNCSYGKDKSIFVNCDVQSRIQLQECYEKVAKEFGKIDIVVNSAGIFDGNNWEKEILTNFVGTTRSTILAQKYLSKEECGTGGVILNISGLAGLKTLYAAPTLSAGYHAIIGLSRSFGDQRNWKRTGVRVVTLCPGITNTNFIKEAETRALNDVMGKNLAAIFCKVPRQNAEACGKAALHVLKYGGTGTVWVVEGSKLYSLNIPNWKTYRALESQLL